jgi:hypothetical protein
VCTIDETIIRLALGANVVKSACMLEGDATCAFVVATSAGQS